MKDILLVILKDYMAVITLFLGAFLGFLFSIWKDKINENRKVTKEKNEFALKRLDEVFLYLTRFNDNTSKTFTSIMEGKDSNTVLDDTAKLAFIIRVHFSHLHDEYKSLLNKSLSYGTYQISSAMTIQSDMKTNGFDQQRYDNMIMKY